LVTCLSLAVIFAVIYLVLTRREKANLLNAKQMAGEMVIDLFTEAVCAALVFDDQTGVSEALNFLGKNREVAYAAVWKRDTLDPSKLGQRVAELRRDADRTHYPIPAKHSAHRVKIGANALTISAAINDPTGAWAGQALVVFSLAREQMLFAELSQRILVAAAATAALIAILLVSSMRALVVRRLSRLAGAAQQLERGEAAVIEDRSSDEVGQLAHALSRMAAAIADREARIQTQNLEMRLVLDNVAQGFVVVSIHGIMSSQRSAILDEWFGRPKDGDTLSSYLAPHAANYAEWFDAGLEAVRDAFFSPEVALDQIPKRFSAAGRNFDVSYTVIVKHGEVERVLVIISDVTAQLAHEQEERQQRELLALFQRILADRVGVDEFLAEAAGLVGAIREESDTKVQQRLVHTLKGNCAIYGLEAYAELAHRIESELVETRAGLSDEQRRLLVDMWKEIIQRVSKLLGRSRRESVEIERAELEALIERARAGMPSGTLALALTDWEREPISRRFERLGRQAVGIARRLRKPEPRIEIDAGGIRLDPRGWAPFWSAMVHMISNAADHGIEDAATRIARGKPEAGTIALSARRTQGWLTIIVRDDGKGIDWEAVRASAARAGCASTTHEDLVDALFADGISTRDEVSATSGRGVGLAALRQVISQLGGTINVHSTAGRGTSFEIAIDEHHVTKAMGMKSEAAPTSLMPPPV
jgi:HPt (histidine-containing phosphotransfer) domain-containing protein/two-component sensor histidine kinase